MFNYQRTQTTRSGASLSAPMRELLFEQGFIPYFRDLEVLHFGEGKDWNTTYALKDHGAKAYAYDPYSKYPTVRDKSYLLMDWDVVISSYVYNVMPPLERREAWKNMQQHCAIQIWAVRCDKIQGKEFFDGVTTKANTFQKSYDEYEARREWPDANVISYHPGKWITLAQSGLLYPRNLSM